MGRLTAAEGAFAGATLRASRGDKLYEAKRQPAIVYRSSPASGCV
jgi:hypothetical protein